MSSDLGLLAGEFEVSRGKFGSPRFNRKCVVCGVFFPCFHAATTHCVRCR